MSNSAASRLVLASYSEAQTIQTAKEALAEIGGRVSCGLVFCSTDYREDMADFLELLQLHAHIPLLIGCSGHGLVGADAEAEDAQGFSLLLLHLPETTLYPVTYPEGELPEWSDGAGWRRALGAEAVDAWVLLAEPDSERVPIEPWLRAFSQAYPGVPCVGGLASGGQEDADFFVLRDRELVETGAVALGFRGGVRLQTLVSQGCRPIGEPLPVTSVDQNIIHSIGTRPAYQVLDEAFQSLKESEKERAKGNLFAGLAMREDREEFHRGDFLIRQILGADQGSGAVAVGAFPRVGQTLQWQLRDRHAADEDLRMLAGTLAAEGVKPFASLLFACGGRGRGLFGSPNHDAGVLAEAFQPHASAGFFCNGEIGPVGGRNFVHGYTASALLFS